LQWVSVKWTAGLRHTIIPGGQKASSLSAWKIVVHVHFPACLGDPTAYRAARQGGAARRRMNEIGEELRPLTRLRENPDSQLWRMMFDYHMTLRKSSKMTDMSVQSDLAVK
jgi:hypothetical protein